MEGSILENLMFLATTCRKQLKYKYWLKDGKSMD